jgi:hypothetical protein
MKEVNEESKEILNKLFEMTTNGYFKLDNDPDYVPLVVDIIETNQLSLCHYGELNGDPMRDPEMVFYKQNNNWYPIYFRNDWMGIEEFSCQISDGQLLVENERQQHNQAEFADMWLENIQQQQNLSQKS